MIKTNIAVIIAIAVIGVAVNSSVVGLPKAYGQGGLISLVAHGAQDVYLTQSNTTKLKNDVTKLQSDETKLQCAANPNTSAQSGAPTDLVAVPAQDVYQLQSDVTKLQSEENMLHSDMAKLQSEGNATSGP